MTRPARYEYTHYELAKSRLHMVLTDPPCLLTNFEIRRSLRANSYMEVVWMGEKHSISLPMYYVRTTERKRLRTCIEGMLMEEGIKHEEGGRRQFETGASRQNAAGKGTPVLVCPWAYMELAKHYEEGAGVHGARNWEKGLPISELVNSLERHIAAFKMDKTDERHDRAIAWNAMALLGTLARIKDGVLPKSLNDMPVYLEGVHDETV